VTEIAKAERLRIEQEHRSILEDVLQEVLTEQPTSFDAIYEKYSDKCTTRELKKKSDKPRGRYSVKQYLREMENEGKLKRVMNIREYFYVVAEEENEEVVSESGHIEVFQANEPNEAIV
jgi:predicted transcriptional regulator